MKKVLLYIPNVTNGCTLTNFQFTQEGLTACMYIPNLTNGCTLSNSFNALKRV